MEPTKQELIAARIAVRKDQRQARKAYMQQLKDGFDSAVTAKIEELKTQE